MPRENTYLAIILKKQPFGEGDELVTVFTKQAGKLRALAKSSKLPKSKLQHGLQVLFLTKLRLAGTKLPKIIGAEVVETFGNIRDNLPAANTAFYVLELALKFTPDEQRNEELFDLLGEFLSFLDKTAGQAAGQAVGLAKFKLEFLQTMGLTVRADVSGPESDIGFSNSRGGFFSGSAAPDLRRIGAVTYRQYLNLQQQSFGALLAENRNPEDLSELQALLSGFLAYHLERDVKSERFL